MLSREERGDLLAQILELSVELAAVDGDARAHGVHVGARARHALAQALLGREELGQLLRVMFEVPVQLLSRRHGGGQGLTAGRRDGATARRLDGSTARRFDGSDDGRARRVGGVWADLGHELGGWEAAVGDS